MYSYKLNNSYTVYVNFTYLNECIKASKKSGKHSPVKVYTTPSKKEKLAFTPLPENTLLKHKVFGCGKVVTTNKRGIMSVAFENKNVKFVY